MHSFNPTYRRLMLVFLTIALVFCCDLPVRSQTNGLSLALEAQRLYSTGNLIQSVKLWQQAETAFTTAGDTEGRIKSSINLSQVLQDLGQYPRACDTIVRAFDPNADCSQVNRWSQKFSDRRSRSSLTTTEAIGLRSLGNILLQKGQLNLSQRVLNLSLEATQNSTELSPTLLVLGNLHRARGNRIRDRWDYDRVTETIDRQESAFVFQPYRLAVRAYQKVEADNATPDITKVQAQLNHLALLIELNDWWQGQIERRIQSWQRLKQTSSVETARDFSNLLSARLHKQQKALQTKIEGNLTALSPDHQGIYARLNYVKSLNVLQQLSKVEPILQQTLKQSLTIADLPGKSYALGYLGEYYGNRGEIGRGIDLTERALEIAENLPDAREISYLWQSQLGRLLDHSGDRAGALSAYTLAYKNLQSLRADLNTNNQVIQFNFRQEVQPVYLRLAGLLLDGESTSAAKSLTAIADTKSQTSSNLELARQVIESLQLAELDNFFQNPCSQTTDTTVTIDRIDPQAAVIYPIVLSDRLEILLSVAGKPLRQFTSKVDRRTIDLTLNSIYDRLYNQSVNDSAVNIFNTTPVDPTELAENTQALLVDLQKMYRWTIAPLENILASEQIETLAFVLNGRLQNLPLAALYDGKQYLLEKYSIALAPSLQLLNTQSVSRTKLKVLAAGLSQQVEVRGEIFPALANVPQELNRIERVFPQSLQLLNKEFTAKNIEQQLKTGFPIVHLATHGIFSSDPKRTFIVTGDRNIITLDALSNLFTSNNDTRPELIVFSACDTATGDERAVLGLAGVAVRSGSSTIASLWSVDDISTSRLMSQFYHELENPATKKVVALQKAQLSEIASLRANPIVPELAKLPPHPYYWSPYVLVGNWQ